MELTALNDVKSVTNEKELTNDIELNQMNEKMIEFNEQLDDYLKNNDAKEVKQDDLKRPIDIDITTEKNEYGDTTILGKITIEKSAAKDLEKIQNKVENVKDKSVSFVQKGLLKIYDAVKDTFVGNIAQKALEIGGKVLKASANVISNVAKNIVKKLAK